MRQQPKMQYTAATTKTTALDTALVPNRTQGETLPVALSVSTWW